MWWMLWWMGCTATPPEAQVPAPDAERVAEPLGPDGAPVSNPSAAGPDGTPVSSPSSAGPDGVPITVPSTVEGAVAGGPMAQAGLMPRRCGRQERQLSCAVQVQGGDFWMGAQPDDPKAAKYDPDATPEEGPVRRVTVEPVWLAVFEASAAGMQVCVDAGLCDAEGVLTDGALATVGKEGRGDHPAAGVSWAVATQYCEALGGRLPTEAEWEFAASKAGTERFPWGDGARCPGRPGSAGVPGQEEGNAALQESAEAACAGPRNRLLESLGVDKVDAIVGNVTKRMATEDLLALCTSMADASVEDIVARFDTLRAAQAVERYPSLSDAALSCATMQLAPLADADNLSSAGLVGLAGSVWEWTSDAFEAGGTNRVQRGGSFMSDDVRAFRSAARAQMPPEATLPDVGVRCAWDSLPEPQETPPSPAPEETP